MSERKTRGSRACVTCRKGKNRCVIPEGAQDGPCERCIAHGLECVFEARSNRAPGSSGGAGGGMDDERLERIEDTVHALTTAVSQLVQAQSQSMHFHQSQPQPQPGGFPYALPPPPAPPQPYQLPPLQPFYHQQPPQHHHQPDSHFAQPVSSSSSSSKSTAKRKRSDAFPELPGYKAPPHPLQRYGIADSTAPSSDDEDVIASTQLTAPFEALAEAAAAASMASNASPSGNTPHDHPPVQPAAAQANERSDQPEPGGTSNSKNNSKKRKRTRPPALPPNAFPSVVQKGLVSEDVAKRIFAFFIENMHRAFPILDPMYDTWESLHERSPWSINAILSVAGQRMPNADADVVKAAEYATEEAHGIARSSLFGPTVRKEGAQAMTILSAWQQNAYLPAGHALRMAHDLSLHRALDKLAESESKKSSPEDSRDMLASARIYISAYWLDSVLSYGAGRPPSGEPVDNLTSRIHHMLEHSLSIKTDYVLAANVHLLRLRNDLEKSVRNATASHVSSQAHRAVDELRAWWREWDDKLACFYDSQSFERKMLLCSLYATEMALVSAALRFQSLSTSSTSSSSSSAATGGTATLSADVKELVMAARQSAASYIDITLDSHALKSSTLRYCLHPTYASAAYSGLLLLKFAKLWPIEDDLPGVVSRCNQLQHLLAGLPGASRFAFTIRIALERFAHQFGLPYTPFSSAPASASQAHHQQQQQQQHQQVSLKYNGPSAMAPPALAAANGNASALDASSTTGTSTAAAAAAAASVAGGSSNTVPDVSAGAFDATAFFALGDKGQNKDWTTGHGQSYPEWLRSDAPVEEQDWAFSDILSTGLDGLFLPTWTLDQLAAANGNEPKAQQQQQHEWWAAQ